MNKLSFLSLFFLFAIFMCAGIGTAFGAVSSSTGSSASGLIDSSAVQVNLTNQNPDAARPGEPVELYSKCAKHRK